MSLPRPPISLNTPIPNEPFSAEEVYYLEGNQGHLPLGAGLYIDPATGEFTDINPNPYTYCTPQFSELPVTYPPYDCETEVNTAGVTDFTDAWNGCSLNDPLPCIDTSSGQYFYQAFRRNDWDTFPTLNFSSGTYFGYTWAENYDLTEFPLINVSRGKNFEGAWYNCDSLTEFPLLDFRRATVLGDRDNLNYGAWENCQSLVSFPAINTSNVEKFDWAWHECPSLDNFPKLDTSKATTFYFTWANDSSLTTFPAGMFDTCSATTFLYAWQNCALSQQSVDNILVSLDTAGQSNGTVNIDGGTSSAPGPAGLAAKASLQGKGWTVSTN